MSTDSNDSDGPTVDSLTKKKEDFLSHGLQDTALGDAVDKQADEKHEELSRHRELVEAEIAVQQARKHGVESEAVEALAETVEELSEEVEAEALVEHAEKTEAREKINELESLANSTEGATSASFEQRAAALREKHGLTEEPSRYEAEALEQDEDVGEAAEALADFRDRKEATVAEEDLPEEAKAHLSQLKQMREQASTPALRQMYENKISTLREEHT